MHNYKKIALISGALAIIAVPAISFAHGLNFGKFAKPVAVGTVASISGNTITLTGKSTTYTIDATNATINKITPATNGAKPSRSTIAVSGIQTGDTLMVMGTASGNNITATGITDGTFMGKGGLNHNKVPAVSGTVSAVSANTLTLEGKNNVSYFVDTTNATIKKFGPATSTPQIGLSQIQTGDKVIVLGTVSGNNIKATQIIDGQFNMMRPRNFRGAKNNTPSK